MSVPVFQAAVMAGCNLRTSGSVGPFAQDTFLEQRIAHDTGIRCTSLHVFVDKVPDDYVAELFTDIGYMMLYAQSLGQCLCFQYFIGLFLMGSRKVRGDIPCSHGYTYNFVTLFL